MAGEVDVLGQYDFLDVWNLTTNCLQHEEDFRDIALDYAAQNIRVNTICPTFIETAMTADMFADPSFRAWVTDRIALGRLGKPADIAAAVAFLAGPAAAYVTGETLHVNGGMYMP